VRLAGTRPLERALGDAEHDRSAIGAALAHVDRLSPLDQQRLLGTWGATLVSAR
jgi:hypothetical protein